MTPLLLPAVAALAGAWWGVTAGTARTPVAATAFAVAAALATAAAVFAGRKQRRISAATNQGATVMILRFIAWASVFAALALFAGSRLYGADSLPGDSRRYEAIVETVAENNHFQTLTLRIISVDSAATDVPPLVSLSVAGFEKEFTPGATVGFTAALRPVNPVNDGIYADDEIDPDATLASRGILHKGFLTSANAIEILRPGAIGEWFRPLGRSWARTIDSAPLSERSRGYLKAFLTGDRTAFDRDDRRIFSAAGVAHLLALSGTHTGVVAMIAGAMLFPLALLGFGRTRWLLAGAAVWVYALATGAQPSVVRAATMLSVFIGSRVMMRPLSAPNALCFAILVLLAVDPFNVADIGFQLSVASVAAIIAFGMALNPFFRSGRVLRSLAGMFSFSLAATLGTSLIAAFHFHFFPIYFLLGNALAGALMPLIVGGGVLLLAADSVGFGTTILASALNRLCSLSDSGIAFVASLPGSTVDDIYFPAVTLIPYAVALVALRCRLSSPKRRYSLVAASLGILALSIAACGKISPPDGDEWFVNRASTVPEVMVRHGNDFLIYSPGRNSDSTALAEGASQRYRHYISRRRLRPAAVTAGTWRAIDQLAGNKSYEATPHDGLLVLPDSTSIFIVGPRTRESDLPDRVTWLIVGKRHNLKTATIAGIVNYDSVAFSSQADSALLARRAPAVDLRNTPLRRRFRTNIPAR